MKKLMVLVLALAMVMSLCGGAMADDIIDSERGVAHSFGFVARCDSTTTYTSAADTVLKRPDSNNHAVYVRHYVENGSSEYTNHFRVIEGMSTTNHIQRGSKWCNVGLNVPIQNNNISSGRYYSIAGRGNTNHYEYDGVASVRLYGQMWVNAIWNP